MVRTSFLALAAAFVTTLGCARATPPPTQKAAVVTSEVAPALFAADRLQRLSHAVFLGDVLLLSKPGPPTTWQGSLQTRDTSRQGPTLDVKRAPSDRVFRVFASDVRQDVDVPDESWICERLSTPAGGSDCASRLARILLAADRSIAYVPCSGRACPLALIEGGDVRLTFVEGLTDVQLLSLTGRLVLLAASQWAEGPARTGRDLVVIDAEPSFRRLAEIRVEEIVRHEDGYVDQRIGEVGVGPTEVRFDGTQQRTHNPTGRTVTVKPVHESYCLTPDGSMRRCEMPNELLRPGR